MDTDNPRLKAKQLAAARDAEVLTRSARSALPSDPTLPPDALALRASGGVTPLEHALAVMADETLEHRLRLDAAKVAISYMHRPPVVRQEIVVSDEQRQLDMARGFLLMVRSGELSPADAERIAARLSPDDAEHITH